MTRAGTKQTMKPMAAAKKLRIYLPAAPAEFREAEALTRGDLARLMTDPPEWLRELHANGPHPRGVVADRLGVSIAGLARGGVTEALTSQQIEDLREAQPAWLAHERQVARRARDEAEERAEKAERSKPGGSRP
jgi:hypothetical protein